MDTETIEARYDAKARAWDVRVPPAGWFRARGLWTRDEAPAAVRRALGAHRAKCSRLVIVPSQPTENARRTRAPETT